MAPQVIMGGVQDCLGYVGVGSYKHLVLAVFELAVEIGRVPGVLALKISRG
jgi:K+-transporting ATPase A subunit